MALSAEQKRKAKRKLFELSDDKERSEIMMHDMEEVQDQFALLNKAISDGSTKKELAELMASMSQGLEKMRGAYVKGMVDFSNAFKEYHENLLKGIQDSLKSIPQPKDLSGFFKDFPTLIAQNNAHSKRTADVISNLKWNASMQIRSMEGSPVTPFILGPNIGVGNGTVATAGTAVQLSSTSIPTTRVIVTNHDANASLAGTGIIVVGDKTVLASTRNGAAIYAGNSQTFYVNNLNLLWVDSTDNTAKWHIYYEKPF